MFTNAYWRYAPRKRQRWTSVEAANATSNAVEPTKVPRKRMLLFEQPQSVADAVYKPQGYALLFCFHDIAKTLPCKRCGRTRSDADAYAEKIRAALRAVVLGDWSST